MKKSMIVNGVKYVYHHSAARGGYTSRLKPEGRLEEYDGRFGAGYIRVLPRWDTTRYVTIEYWIEEGEEK